MSLIHQMLYESKDFGRVDFGEFLGSLATELMSSYGALPARVSLLIDSATIALPIDAAIPCGLVVNELVSNALKHAFPGERRGQIKIDLTQGCADEVTLSVSDDGVGIPEALDIANATTLGLQMITLLADQLAADLTMQRANPTCLALRFKVAQ
jgi:two-component system, sensor histidine kinase PdtaS